jgi:uncharacterized integral membrane protein
VKRLSFILTLPVTAVVLIFALANRGPVALSLWPLDIVIEMPIYLAVLGSLFLGFLAGGLVAWIAAGRTRSRARWLARETQRQAAEIAEMKKRQSHGAPPTPAAGTALAAPTTTAHMPVPTP